MTKTSMWTIYDHPADHPDSYVARSYMPAFVKAVDVKFKHEFIDSTLGGLEKQIDEFIASKTSEPVITILLNYPSSVLRQKK